MSTFITNTDFSSVSAFAGEVRKAFESAIPPVVISIDKRENVEPFTALFQSERGYLGKRVSCKHAKSGSFGNFTINELFSFDEDRFPILLSFKQIAELEDFAKGWARTFERAAAPVEQTQPLAAVQGTEQSQMPKQEVPNTNKGRITLDEVKAEQDNATASSKTVAGIQVVVQEFTVNPFAESILDTCLKLELILGWILAIGAFFVGIIGATNGDGLEGLYIGISIPAAALILLVSYIIWARGKIIINISRNLFNINAKLKK